MISRQVNLVDDKERLGDNAERHGENNDDDKESYNSNSEDTEGAKEVPRRRRRATCRRENYSHLLLTFKDVKESMEKFSGDDHVNVEIQLNDFEEMAETCKWVDIQDVTYA